MNGKLNFSNKRQPKPIKRKIKLIFCLNRIALNFNYLKKHYKLCERCTDCLGKFIYQFK